MTTAVWVGVGVIVALALGLVTGRYTHRKRRGVSLEWWVRFVYDKDNTDETARRPPEAPHEPPAPTPPDPP